MTIIDVPPGPAHEFQFKPEDRAVKGLAAGTPEALLLTTVQLCEPQSTPMTGDLVKDDPELKAFFEAEKDTFRFDLVRLDFTLSNAEGEQFDKAWLEVKMKRGDGAAQPLPITWLMKPLNEVDAMKASAGFELGIDLFKIVSAKGHSGGEVEKKTYAIQAFNLQRPDPFWELSRTSSTSISGTYTFRMVVRSQAGTQTKGVVQLSASVRRHKYLVIPTSEALFQKPQMEFVLPRA